jgi:hypothetical protein
MEATLEQIPRAGQIQLAIQVSANMNYSAQAARRIAGRFLADEMGYLLRGGEPTLAVSEHICWRVPVVLAFPATGPVGTVGTVDVDVETGQLYITPERIAELTRNAQDLAAHYSAVECPAA